MREKNNKGFSLVELIVVIAIMVITAAIGVNAFSNTDGRNVKNASTLIGTYLNSTKTYNLAKAPSYMTISYTDSDGYVVSVSDVRQEEKKLSGNLTITYKTSDGTVVTVDENHPLRLSFQRSSGAFLPVIDAIAEDGSYTYRTVGSEGSSTYIYCNEITVSAGTRSSVITLYRRTGQHEIN